MNTVPKGQVTNLLSRIKTEARDLPTRMIVYGVEGIGKTSFAVQAPDPLVLMTKGETGLETLLSNGVLKDVGHVPEILDWPTFIGYIDALIKEDVPARTLVIDCINGAETLCNSYVCETQYENDWGPKGFANFGKGYESASQEWNKLLYKLDLIREKGIGIIGIAHAQVKPFNNPEGADYDRFIPDMNKRQWSLTAKWADMILFMNYITVVQEDGFKGKGKGGNVRIAYAQRSAAWDAKNRHNMPESFSLGNSAKEGWANFKKARQRKGDK